MPEKHRYDTVRPIKVLHGVPRYVTYRDKLQRKWRRKGYNVRFA